jgi:hypothetical protein
MIHEWFMHFGLVALLLFLGSLFATRFVANRHPSRGSDDKQAAAFGTLGIGACGVVVLVIAGALVLFGASGTITGWVGVTLIGIAIGVSKNTD